MTQSKHTDRSRSAESVKTLENKNSGQDVRPAIDQNRDDFIDDEAVIQQASKELGFIRYSSGGQ